MGGAIGVFIFVAQGADFFVLNNVIEKYLWKYICGFKVILYFDSL